MLRPPSTGNFPVLFVLRNLGNIYVEMNAYEDSNLIGAGKKPRTVVRRAL